MFERFTERARQVVVLAQEEARGLEHDYIGTEHLLLGLLAEREGLAAGVLESLGVTLERVREQVVQMIGRGEKAPERMIPFTPRAKKTLELALRESQQLGHGNIETEHVLLGLLRENEGVASRILLTRFDLRPQRIRREVLDRVRWSDDPSASEEMRRGASEGDRLVLQFELSITPPAAGGLDRLHVAAVEAIKGVYERGGATVHYIGRRSIDRGQS